MAILHFQQRSKFQPLSRGIKCEVFVTLENFKWPWDLQCKWIQSARVGLSTAKFVSLRGTEIWTSHFFAKTWPLFTGVNRNVETVLGEVEKSGFYCFAQQRGPQWAKAPKTVWPTLEQVVSFTVFREQDVVSSWTILGLVGFRLVSRIINLLVPTSLGSMFLWSAVFIQRSASCENNLGMCVRPLSILFRKLRVWWFGYVAELWSKLLAVS